MTVAVAHNCYKYEEYMILYDEMQSNEKVNLLYPTLKDTFVS